MKKVIFTTLLILILFASVGVVFAEDNSSDKAKARLQEIEQRVASKSAQEGKSKGAFLKNHFQGTITTLNSTTLTVTTSFDIKTVLTLSTTKYIQLAPGKTTIKFSDLKVKDKVIVYGIGKDEVTGTALLIAKNTSKEIKRQAVFGFISKINGKELTINHLQKADHILATVLVVNETVIKEKSQNLSFSDLKIQDVVAVSGSIGDKGNLIAKLVHRIPGLGLSKTATSSATPSAK